MKIEIIIEEKAEEKSIKIITNKIDEEVEEIQKYLSNYSARYLLGYKDYKAVVIKYKDIYRIYISQRQLFIETEKETFLCKSSYVEIKQLLSSHDFFEISRNELVNLNKIDKLDFSLKGTICLYLNNKTVTYISRRRMDEFKKRIGIKRR